MGANAGLYTQAAGLTASVYGAATKGAATKTALGLQAAVDDQNAQLATWQAQDAIARGETNAQRLQQRGAALKGTQRARLAANGVAFDSASALDILTSTDVQSEQDQDTTRSNAEREAWGYRVNASNTAGNAALLRNRASSEGGVSAAFSTLLTGAGAVAKSWYKQSTGTSSFIKGTD